MKQKFAVIDNCTNNNPDHVGERFLELHTNPPFPVPVRAGAALDAKGRL